MMAKKAKVDGSNLPKTLWRVETNGVAHFSCDKMVLVEAFSEDGGIYSPIGSDFKTTAYLNELGVAKEQSCGYIVCKSESKIEALHSVLRKLDDILEEEKKRLKKMQTLNTSIYNAYEKAFSEALDSEHGMEKVRRLAAKGAKKTAK